MDSICYEGFFRIGRPVRNAYRRRREAGAGLDEAFAGQPMIIRVAVSFAHALQTYLYHTIAQDPTKS
jgi:hypothetical protein